MLAWQVHLPISILITILYKLMILFFPSTNFVVNIHANGYYFFFLPMILYFLALSLWALISFIIDYLIFDSIHRFTYPIFNNLQNELNYQINTSRLIQLILLLIPLVSAITFSGSNGHIALFLIALFHTIWRGTINRRLREILTTLLLFHGLLVLLNLTGFIIHIKSLIVEGLYPLYMLMPDVSLISALFCILAFYCRFLFSRSQWKFLQKLKQIFYQYNQLILIVLAISSQIFCSYSMYYLWIYIFSIFIHATVIFFVPTHQE